MGTLLSVENPPPVVLVPPLFHRPDLASRYRMTESSYDVLFGKVVRKRLFADYNGQADEFIAHIMLKPPEDPNVDITATFSARSKENINGETRFRWQRNAKDSSNFMELSLSTLTKSLKLQSCAFAPALGLGAFSTFSILPVSRFLSKGENHLGIRYGSSNLSIGTIIDSVSEDISCLWFVGKLGKITAGCQWKPKPHQSPGEARGTRRKYLADEFGDPKRWSFAVDYGLGRSGPLNTSYNFCLEVQENSKLIASYYHHLVVQRQVKNPFEGSEVVGITNYLDIGLEFEQSLGESNSSSGKADSQQSAMRIGASWQANKNILVKAKLGSLSAGVVLLLKSWWQPSFTVSFTAVRDYMQNQTKFGLGLQVENFGGTSYEMADANYVMVTPTKKHLAEGMVKDARARPMLNTDIVSQNMRQIPAEFCPRDTIL